jgi:hypothetical protein
VSTYSIVLLNRNIEQNTNKLNTTTYRPHKKIHNLSKIRENQRQLFHEKFIKLAKTIKNEETKKAETNKFKTILRSSPGLGWSVWSLAHHSRRTGPSL